MTYKAIVYSRHAMVRLVEQQIPRRDVRRLLAHGDRYREWTKPGGDQRWSCRGPLGSHQAMVVFVENAHRIEIITVYLLD